MKDKQLKPPKRQKASSHHKSISSSCSALLNLPNDQLNSQLEDDLKLWFQSTPRWPEECQVIPKRNRCIRSIPSQPEAFYESTGREAEPRPIGDDHGTVVFEYTPSSSLAYFSRSVPAPFAAPPQKSPSPSSSSQGLTFESRFECGNLARVIRITDSYYELYLRPDLYTTRHCQWFYFQIKNMEADMTYRFSIVNFTKPDSLYTCGMKPVLYSEIEAERHSVGWCRVGNNIRYYRNDSSGYDVDDGATFTLTFTLNFPYDNDTVYLAHCYPYTYSDLQDDLKILMSDAKRRRYCNQKLLCKTMAGNNVYILTISNNQGHTLT